MTQSEATKARRTFFDTYQGLAAWQRRTAAEAEYTKQVKTPGGRIRDFSVGGYRYTEALNTPIQGGAVEVLMATLAMLDAHLDGLDAKLVNVVHDELVLEAAEADVDAVRHAVEAAMLEGYLAIFPDPRGTTTGLAKAGVGPNWGEAKA